MWPANQTGKGNEWDSMATLVDSQSVCRQADINHSGISCAPPPHICLQQLQQEKRSVPAGVCISAQVARVLRPRGRGVMATGDESAEAAYAGQQGREGTAAKCRETGQSHRRLQVELAIALREAVKFLIAYILNHRHWRCLS